MKPLTITTLASVFSLATLVPTAFGATSGTETVVETNHGWVSYHSGPKLSSPILGRLQLGDEAPLVEKTNAYWYEVRWNDENVYITTNSAYTKLAAVDAAAATTTTSTASAMPASSELASASSTPTSTTPAPSSTTMSSTALNPATTPAQYVEPVQGWVSYHSSAGLSSPVVGRLQLGDKAPLVKKANAYWYEIHWNNQDVYITTNTTYTKVVMDGSSDAGNGSSTTSGTAKVSDKTTSTAGTPSTDTATSTTSTWQTEADKVIQTAQTQLGVPYLWGHQEPGVGFDCSNFTAWSYRTALGISFSGSSQTQRASVGTPVALSDIREGDLLFFATQGDPTGGGHVGIYMGDGQVIQEGGGWGKVTIEPLSGTWLGRNLVFARRVITGN